MSEVTAMTTCACGATVDGYHAEVDCKAVWRARAEKAEAEIAAAAMKHRAMADMYRRDLDLLDRARWQIITFTAHADDVWFWQGEGDRPESLTCPVVMSAETLRGILHASEAAPLLRGVAAVWEAKSKELGTEVERLTFEQEMADRSLEAAAWPDPEHGWDECPALWERIDVALEKRDAALDAAEACLAVVRAWKAAGYPVNGESFEALAAMADRLVAAPAEELAAFHEVRARQSDAVFSLASAVDWVLSLDGAPPEPYDTSARGFLPSRNRDALKASYALWKTAFRIDEKSARALAVLAAERTQPPAPEGGA